MSYNRHLTIVTGESLYPRIIILTGSHCILGYSDRDSFCTGVTQSYCTKMPTLYIHYKAMTHGTSDRRLLRSKHDTVQDGIHMIVLSI